MDGTFHPTECGDVQRPGVSLRNYFAIEIAKAMLMRGNTNGRDPEYIAKKAYAIADRLLKEGANHAQ